MRKERMKFIQDMPTYTQKMTETIEYLKTAYFTLNGYQHSDRIMFCMK